MALTDKQEMFCREYLIDLNATQAAIRLFTILKLFNVYGFPKMVALSTSSQHSLKSKCCFAFAIEPQ